MLFARDGRVLTLTLNRPGRGNAIDRATALELEAAVNSISRDVTASVLVITGAGTHFCTGGDTEEYANLERSELKAQFSRMSRVCRHIERLPIPVIAAINGIAMGGGFELALACDLRVASAHSWLQLPNARMGLPTAWGGGRRLTDLVGRARALDLLLSGRRTDAVEAERIGLLDRVAENGLMAALDEARHIATAPRAAIVAAKRDIGHLPRKLDDDARLERFLDLWYSIGTVHRSTERMPSDASSGAA